jgi:hypothetical protein
MVLREVCKGQIRKEGRVFPGERDQGIVHTVVVTGRRPL